MFYILHTTWQLILIVFGLIIFSFITWRWPKIGAWLMIFLAPLYLLKIGNWPLTVLEALIWVFVLVWTVKKVQNCCHLGLPPRLVRSSGDPGSMTWIPACAGMTKKKLSLAIKSGLFWPILLILAGVFLSTIFSVDWRVSAGILKSWFLAPIIFVFILRDVFKEDALKEIFLALFASVAVVAIIGFVYWLFGRLTYDGRLAAFYLSPNHLAMFLALGIIAGFGLWPEAKKTYQKIFLLLASCFLFFVFYFTYSYGAWLGLAAVAAFVLFCLRKYKLISQRPLFLVSCFLFLVIMLVLFFQLNGDHNEKLTNLLSFPRSSWDSRLMVWQAAGQILKDHWFLGIGPGLFQSYYLAYQKFFPPYLEWAVPQPHNLFLAWWLQAGIIGFVGFIWLTINFFRQRFESLIKIPSWPAVFLMAMMVYILVHGLADTTFWKNDLALVFWVITILGCRAGRRAG